MKTRAVTWAFAACVLGVAAWLQRPDPLVPAACSEYAAAKHSADLYNALVVLCATGAGLLLVMLAAISLVAYRAYHAKENQDAP